MPEWGSNRDLRLFKQAALTTAPAPTSTYMKKDDKMHRGGLKG